MHLKQCTKKQYLGTQSDTYFSMPSKDYLDYNPLTPKVKKKVKIKKVKENTVTKNIFELMFGFGYPKTYNTPSVMRTYKHPKQDGSNGKISRFR